MSAADGDGSVRGGPPVNLAFVVNEVDTELAVYTTSRLALEAHRRGHGVWYLGLGDLGLRPDGALYGHAARVPDRAYRTTETFLAGVQEAEREALLLEELDVFWLRNDPAVDFVDRPWARTVGIDFGNVLADLGTLVLNDPTGLARAANKMYLQRFPESVRIRTLITRELESVRAFQDEEGGDIVLKPLQGSGGDRVFVVRADDGANLNQIFEAVAGSGYVIAQEFIPAAAEGDVRLFLINGCPLEVGGKIAAFRRVHSGDDLRNNMSVGGRAEKVKVTDAMLALGEMVRPGLIEDGMFLVGLDIAGGKILEINVFSPGGLGSCSHLEKVDFASAVIDAVEAKVEIVAAYGRVIPNSRLATLGSTTKLRATR
jgi:glutathione synthase